MKIPYFNDTKAREDLNIKDYSNTLTNIAHLTPQERDQFRRYLTNEFKHKRDQRRKEIGFRNVYR